MSVANNRRLKVIGYAKYRLRILLYLLRIGKFRMAYSFLFVCLFSRESGLALLDHFWRAFPKWNPYPWYMQVETTTRCHLKCTMCEHTYWYEKLFIIESGPRFNRILDADDCYRLRDIPD